MVLEEATSDQEPSFSETQPTSDIDRYASGNSNPNYTPTTDYNYIRLDQANVDPIYINMAELPQPFFMTKSQAEHQQRMQRALVGAALHTTQILKRPLTREEAEAIAFYNNKATRIASLGFPVGLTLAAFRAYATKDKGYRFPFWSPMKEGSGRTRDKFFTLRGAPARLMWSTARFSSWAWVGSFIGLQVFALYAVSHSAVGRMMDPRLKAFKDAALAASRERRGQPPGQQNEGEGARKGETYETARQRRSVQKQVPMQRSRQQDDDMSPTGGAFQQDVKQAESGSGLMDDGQVRSYEYSRQQEQVRADAENNYSSRPASPNQQQSQQRQRGVEQSNRSSSPSDQSRSKSSGSSWDRLRQDAMSGNQNQSSSQRGSQTTQDTRNSSSGENSFSFSQGDEDRQLAKSEAQKDFDSRMDRERAGKDFSEGRRGGGRW